MGAANRKLGRRRWEPHVRLHRHELESAAYRTLSTDARALLIELRARFTGKENRVYLSVRDAEAALGVSVHRVLAAFGELKERGWIVLIEPGAFSRKTRHATLYALGSEPLTDAPGAVAPKAYMRWQPPTDSPKPRQRSTERRSTERLARLPKRRTEKNTAYGSEMHGLTPVSRGHEHADRNEPDGLTPVSRKRDFSSFTVSHPEAQIADTTAGRGGASADCSLSAAEFCAAAMMLDERAQLLACFYWVASRSAS